MVYHRATTAFLIVAAVMQTSASWGQVSVVDRPGPGEAKALYVGNRAPLVATPFMKLPPGSVMVRGWLGQQLLLEKEGMIGHLKEISPWLNFQTSAWASKDGKGERGWEEMPYWLKGYG